MQYVRSISGSVSKTWNSINPATLSGAIDVIVVEQEDGSLACSPFHVRFGKFSLLRPSEKKVEFRVNGVKQDYSMKLGEGGEAFFVFETFQQVPADLQTSPLVSPAASPAARPTQLSGDVDLTTEPEPLDLATVANNGLRPKPSRARAIPWLTNERRANSDFGKTIPFSTSPPPDGDFKAQMDPSKGQSQAREIPASAPHDNETSKRSPDFKATSVEPERVQHRSASPPPLSKSDVMTRAINLSKKLWTSNIPTQVTETGDLMLDITGYKSSEDEALRAEVIARKLLSEELEGNYDIGALIGADEKGNLWIYSSEEAKEAAAKRVEIHGLQPEAISSADALSDPGYQSDETQSVTSENLVNSHLRTSSDTALGLSTPPRTPDAPAGNPNRNYAKTLRLTSDQLRGMNLKPGANSMSFTVNRATCPASIFLWKYDTPIVISDIDGTITKSDALGHVLNMIGRDWTHIGVAKLYGDIVANGYNILYLTSRSTGQADSTRAYLIGVAQEGHKLPRGPVIMSPDRTIAALRREIYLRKPEVFKMACLRDIMNLYNHNKGRNPFYAGFGNRLTDALSYRSVNIPSTRIFTINSNAEVSMDLLSLNRYKTGYTSMREIVDHFFPPVGLLVTGGGEEFTDFNYWRDKPVELVDFTDSESEEDDDDDDNEDDDDDERSVRSEDEGSEGAADEDDRLGDSYLGTQDSIDEENQLEDSIIESIEADLTRSEIELSVIRRGSRATRRGKELDALDLVSAAVPKKEIDRGDVQQDLKELTHTLNTPAKNSSTNRRPSREEESADPSRASGVTVR